ncbi:MULTISPECIES: PRC-barrel domain-containing protein [Pontibacillus]|uniref:PRC-barrel domain-containing protein n=1 Tax=Pontibacillus chungwhensis TaxID=265426 RepID=A0ABY8UXL0_9BACI|nr:MULTISPECIES: PRC-barrel domain-containing protein [Pontibacillus]MCD5323739.1 PRC-barrel domain-containing protein [Pontibacillus sp. HN14]WIF97104.1 PRC-barrel domain-containing protein [Pontibacillus chungwhensis]
MKRSHEITELPIISIVDGKEVGRVKSLVINPDEGHVDFLTIEHKDWQVSVKAIPFKKVIGVGEYAVTIESTTAILDLDEIPIANELINKKVKIIGSKVMTRKGQLIGEVTEYYVNDDTGKVIAASVQMGNEEVVLESASVVTYSEHMTIVSEEALTQHVTTLEELTGEPESAPAKVTQQETVTKEPVAVAAEEKVKETVPAEPVPVPQDQPASSVQDELESTLVSEETTGAWNQDVPEDVEPQLELVEEVTPEEESASASLISEEVEEVVEEEEKEKPASKLEGIHNKQLQLLKGKVVQKDIVDARGNILFNEGDELTEDDVKLAQDQGPSVVVDLTMSVEG